MKNEVFLSSGVNFLRIDFASFEVIGSPKQDLIFEPSQTIRIPLIVGQQNIIFSLAR